MGKTGDYALTRWRTTRQGVAVLCAVLSLAVRRRCWPPCVREVLARQILFTGVDAVRLTLAIAALTGISVVSQAELWLREIGQSDMLGRVLSAVLVREVGPLLVNFVVIGRSGVAVAAELAVMRTRGEVGTLEAQGIEPMVYLVMPRVLAMAVSVFGLTVIFVAGSLAAAHAFGLLLGTTSGDPTRFFTSVLLGVTPRDVLTLLLKTLVPGAAIGAVCCVEGLAIGGAATEIPQAVTRAVVRSIGVLLVISAIVSVLSYV